MILQKYDFQDHEYHDYIVPDEARIALYSEDMDLKIDCTSCLRSILYGESFTSQKIHTQSGLGFPVCDDCYEAETNERLGAKATHG